MILGLALLACVPERPDPPDAPDTAQCEPSNPGTAACPIDACADGCGGGVACCIATHGYGLEGNALEQLGYACSGDECDPSQYLSEAAAICAAHAQGLGPGLSSCAAGFTREGGFYWRVHNAQDLPCDTDWDTEGVYGVHYLDAVTGEFVRETFVYYSSDSGCR